MSNARNLADLLDSTGDVKSDALDNVAGLPDAIDVNASAPADSLNLNASGNVGIGNTTTNYQLTSGEKRLRVGDGLDHGVIDIYSGSTKWNALTFSDNTTNVGYSGKIGYYHNTNYMQFDVNGSERMRIDSSGNLKYNSGFGSVGTAYGCRAWCLIRAGFANAPTFLQGGNISSIADAGGNGSYTQYIQYNFSNAMPDNDYAIVSGWGGYLRQYSDYEAWADDDSGHKNPSYVKVDFRTDSAGTGNSNTNYSMAVFR